jgi:hypothetical protein
MRDLLSQQRATIAQAIDGRRTTSVEIFTPTTPCRSEISTASSNRSLHCGFRLFDTETGD